MVRSQTSTSSRDSVTGSSVSREIEADAREPDHVSAERTSGPHRRRFVVAQEIRATIRGCYLQALNR
jgi:hypothetical protein